MDTLVCSKLVSHTQEGPFDLLPDNHENQKAKVRTVFFAPHHRETLGKKCDRKRLCLPASLLLSCNAPLPKGKSQHI
jgi:hypothetical protein